jgi:hypothetical protein
MERKPFKRAFLIILLAAGLLSAYPMVYEQIPFLRRQFRTYDPFGSIFGNPFVSDSLRQTSERDSLQALLPKYNGREYLAPFYRILRSGKEQIRIAHYGDSSIEGDLITASFRDSLQSRFGGAGIGFVPIVDPVAGFRRTVIHTFSDHWHLQQLRGKNEQGRPRGIAGSYASTWTSADSTTAGTDSPPSNPYSESPATHWVFYRAADLFPGIHYFPQSRLFYGGILPDSSMLEEQAPLVYMEAGGQPQRLLLNGAAPVNQRWLERDPVQGIFLKFELPSSLPLYGVSFESPDGIIVDNFPSRGNSGAALQHIDMPTMRAFQGMLDYDLVMFQFGLNILNPDMTDYSWYEREMGQVLAHFRKAMPGACLLILGPSDRATRYGGQLQTDPSVPRITEALRRTAERHEAAFFSFFEAMGGEGSMIRWVDQHDPRLANLDYTHFNFEGARQASLFLLEFLLEGYDQYERGDLVEDPIGARIPASFGKVSRSLHQNPDQ